MAVNRGGEEVNVPPTEAILLLLLLVTLVVTCSGGEEEDVVLGVGVWVVLAVVDVTTLD